MSKIVNLIENLENTNWFNFWDKVGNIATILTIGVAIAFMIVVLYMKLDIYIDKIYKNKKAKKNK